MTHAADYGKALEPTATLAARGAMDAAISGNHLFYIGYSYLYVADISDPLHPKEVGKAGFRGAGRQIAIEGNLACVTARTDGLFLFDISDPAKPKLLAHYDTIELATGIDLHGDLAFVAQRQYGVEIVDISDPSHPKYVSKIRTGEAQSVIVRGHRLYVGDWNSQITIIDISDPRKPRIVSRTDLGGFGDGMDIQNGWLYAATGHHARLNGRHVFQRKEGDPGFGAGHGMEVWSLADPAKPVFASRVKFPIQHTRGFDMWTAWASGKYVFCADSASGVFVVDVSDPHHAKTVAHYSDVLVGGLAVGNGAVYAACPKKGLVVLDAKGMARYMAPERGETIALSPAKAPRPRNHRLYRPDGQVRAMAFVGDYAVVAAGMAGVRVLKLWPKVEEVSHIDTPDFAFYVDACDGRIFVSEGRAGLGIYEHTGDGAFKAVGRFKDKRGQAIRCARVNGQNRYAIAETSNRFHFIDVSDPSAPREVLDRQVAIIYGDQISHGLVDGRYVCTSDHRHPMRWYDLKAKAPDKIDTGVDLLKSLGFFDGAVSVGDRLLVTRRGGYQLAPALGTDLAKSPLYKSKRHMHGKPAVYGNGLFVVARHRSTVGIADISDIEHPRFLRTIETKGSPSDAVVRNGALIVCDGYNGLAIYDDFVEKLGLEVDAKSFLPASH